MVSAIAKATEKLKALANEPPVVPPSNLEAEENVLGAMLISPGAIGIAAEILRATDFYRASHGLIFRIACELYASGEPVDVITLIDALEERGLLEDAGGSVRIRELAHLVPATANVGHHAQIVSDLSTLRGLILAGQEIAKIGWDRLGETSALVDQAEQVMFDLAHARVQTEFAEMGDLLEQSAEQFAALYEAGSDLTGVPTGFRDLDKLTAGLQPGNLVVVAARPSMGKSAIALCIAANVSIRHRLPVGLFTLEMSQEEVTMRLLCSEARIEAQRLRAGRLTEGDWKRVAAAYDRLAKAPIFVDDNSGIAMTEIRTKARRLKAKNPDLALIIVDYMQLMASGSKAESRVVEVSQISRSLKVLAQDLGVPVIAMSQLSRAVEQRHDKRPILSDLRESGSIEQDADIVMFVYRDEYYNEETTEQRGLAEIIFAKHRNGPKGTEKLTFLNRFAKFADLGIR